MLSKANNILGVPVALVKICLCVITHIESSLLKNHLSLLPKHPKLCTYVGAQKLKLLPYVINQITAVKIMAIEIEHKFLLSNDSWRSNVNKSVIFKQGYLNSLPTSSIRIRISDDKAWLNIKSATIGNQRSEYEYEIPYKDALEIIDQLCKKPIIEKTRHYVLHKGNIWEIDEFHGDNQGLIVAEIELASQNSNFEHPEWIGIEVTEDLRYYNNNLANNPYNLW